MNEAATSSRSLRFFAGKGNALSSALHDRLQRCCCSALKARLDVVRKKFSRKQLLQFTANLKVELIGMEASGGSHFQGRASCEQAHEVRLMPAQDVKPYVKTNKSDYIDAEAVGRPKMRFVPIKSDDQLDIQFLYRVRERWGDASHSGYQPNLWLAARTWNHLAQGAVPRR